MTLTYRDKLIIFHDTLLKYSLEEIDRQRKIGDGIGVPAIPTSLEKSLYYPGNIPLIREFVSIVVLIDNLRVIYGESRDATKIINNFFPRDQTHKIKLMLSEAIREIAVKLEASLINSITHQDVSKLAAISFLKLFGVLKSGALDVQQLRKQNIIDAVTNQGGWLDSIFLGRAQIESKNYKFICESNLVSYLNIKGDRTSLSVYLRKKYKLHEDIQIVLKGDISDGVRLALDLSYKGLNGYDFDSTFFQVEAVKEELLAQKKIIIEQRDLLDKHNKVIQQTKQNTVEFYNVRDAVYNFIGREEILRQIHNCFTQGKSFIEIIGGLGGMGKTQTALQYIKTFKAEYGYRVRWIDAESKSSLDSSFREFARKLKLTIDKKTDDEIRKLVIERLDDNIDQALLVFDNVVDRKLVALYIPNLSGKQHHHVMITTRDTKDYDKHASRSGEDVIKLVPFTQGEALRYIKEILPEVTDEDAIELAKLFDNIPLGLSQSVAYIENNALSIKEYIDEYRRIKGQGLPDHLHDAEEYRRIKGQGLPDHLHDAEYEKEAGHVANIYTTLTISLRALYSMPQAVEMLRICSYLHADAIPEYLFDSLFDSPKAKKDAIAILKGYSLISVRIEEDTKFIYIHRIVQEVTRYTIDGVDVLKQAIILLNDNMHSGLDRNKIISNKALIEHVITLLQCNLLSESFIELAYLHDKMGCFYEIIEYSLNKAISFYKRAYVIKTEVLSSLDDFDVAESQTSIARTIWKQGHSNIAVAHYKQAINTVRNIIYPTENHIKLAEALSNLGRAYLATGKMLTSIEFLESSLNMYKHLELQEEYFYAEILHNLAIANERTGNLEFFNQYCKKALDLRKGIYVYHYPLIALSLNNYGYSLCVIKNIEEGIKFLKEALDIYEVLHGDNNNPDTARTLNNLGYYYVRWGWHEQGLKYQIRSLEMREKIYDYKNHPAIAASLVKLGKAKHTTGDQQSSLSFHKQALVMRQNLFPNKEHPDIAESLCYVAYALKTIGGIHNIKLCLIMLDQSIKMMKNIYPDGHPLILKYSAMIKFEYRQALSYIKLIANEVSIYRYSDCYQISWKILDKIWNPSNIFITEDLIGPSEIGCLEYIEAPKVLEYFYSKKDLSPWILKSYVKFEGEILALEEFQHKKISFQTDSIVRMFIAKEAIELAPMIKYSIKEILHLPLPESPEIFNNNYLWIGMHYVICNIGMFNIFGRIEPISSLMLSSHYANRILTYEYFNDLRQEKFQNTKNKSINNPIEFIEKCGPDILSQAILAVMNNEVSFAPTIYDITISTTVGGMQCYQQHKQTTYQIKEQSIMQTTIPYITDTIACITVGQALFQNHPPELTTFFGKMMTVKQGFVVMSVVVMTDYITKLVLSTCEDLLPEKTPKLSGEIYEYFN